MRERLFRDDAFEHARSPREDFDPIAEGKRYGLAPGVSAALWERVRREATRSNGLCDEGAARARFAQRAELMARQRGPEPFHWTQLDVASGSVLAGNPLARGVPGKTTQVLALASARARVVLGGVPGRTTLTANQGAPDVGSPEASRGFFRRYVSGGKAACAKLERAIASRDHYAAVVAIGALKQELASARRHLANGLERDEGLRAELAELEGPAEQLLAKLPDMSAGSPWALWGPDSAAKDAATHEIEQDEAEAQALHDAAAERAQPEVAPARPAGEVAQTASGKPAEGQKQPAEVLTAADPTIAAAALHERLQRTFGGDARDVALRTDDGRAGTAEAVTINETAFIGRWDDDALLRVGHEVAHAIQQRRGRAMGETDAVPIPSSRRASLESEAERAGHALVGGVPFAVRGAVSPGVALFRGGPAIPPASVSIEGAREPELDPKLPPDEQPGQHRGERSGQRRGEPPENQADPGQGDGSGAAARSSDGAHSDGHPRRDAAAGPASQAHAGAARVSHATSGGAGEGAVPSGGGGTGAGMGSAAAHPARSAAVDASDPGSLLSSLQHAPASALTTTMASVQAATSQAFQSMRSQAQQEIPRIQAPTGLLARADGGTPREQQAADAGTTPREPTAVHPVPASPGPQRTPERLVHEAPPAPPMAPTQLAGGDGPTHDQAQGQGQPAAQDPALARSAQPALAGIQLGANQVPTTATEVPAVDLRGEADPSQMEAAHAASQHETVAAAADARRATREDRGENAIFPNADPEMLEAQLAEGKAGPARLDGGGAPGAAPGTLPPEAVASIDAHASPVLSDKIATENQRFAAGKAEQDAAKQAAHQQASADMAQAESDARARQIEAQTQARGEVATARADWQHEIDHIDSDFRTQAAAVRDQHRRRIANEQQSANRRAAEHIQDAERQAADEKRKAEDEARKKKEEGKQQSGGFIGWLKSKAKALIDGIKAAVNLLYENLRKAVKAIFEACKKLALGVIELARKAIVGLIKAYGEILKGLVKIALAAFPRLRDRILARIDQAVQRATQLVNSIAGGLKKAVAALIDFLAKTIDSILGLIQDLYNAALTVIGMLITGEFAELMRKVGQVIAAAKTAPGQFETAAYEELLGGDLDQPLSPAELIAAGRTPPMVDPAEYGDEATGEGAHAGGVHAEAAPAAEGEHEEGGEPMPTPPWTEANVGVDEVAEGEQLEPELEGDVRSRTGGGNGTVEFGESNDETRSLDHMLGTTGAAGAQDARPQPAADAQHGAQPDGAQAQGVAQQPASQVGADGLTSRERAQVKWQLMKKGLADWWAQNWPYVLAGGVLAVAGFIVANILTGGAILAALPAIMTVIGYVMAGVAVVKIAEHVRDFLSKAWNGDIRGGGKSLAKGMAAGAIELLMLLTFKVGAAAMRGARAAARGSVHGARAAARGVVRAGKTTTRVASAAAGGLARGAQYVIRAGKVLLRGVGRAISRGVKRLRELGARLLSRTRFKGFRLRIEGRRWRLEGRINPWIVIASGDIKIVDEGTEDAQFLTKKQLAELRQEGATTNRLQEFDARRYHETTSQGVGKVGDGLTGDHIPSRAALVERFKLDNPGKPVPEDLINREGVTVVLQGTDHATLSRTYAGRNTAAQILEDARDLGAAFGRDADAILSGLHRDGRLTLEIVGAYQKAYNLNVMKGVFSPSSEIDRMLNRFLALVRSGS